MATTNLGRVVPLDKGEYDANVTYELNHIVHYNGSVYWHYGATATTGVAPSDTTVWRVVIDAQAVDAYVGRSETAAGSAEAAEAAAEAAQSAAEDNAEDAEAWAVGQIGGTDVPSSDSRYHNNAKYYKEQAQNAAQIAQAVAEIFPTGGTAGQILAKASDANYDTHWIDNEGGVGGGLPTTGGTMSGAINMDGNAITNLPQASASGDAVSYGQVAQMVATDGGTEVTTWSANHLYIVNNGETVDLANPTTTSVNVRYLVTNCSAGDQFIVTATGGSSYRAYSFIDENSKVLSVSNSNAALTDYVIVAPTGSAKLVVNDKTLNGYVYSGKFPDLNTASLVIARSTLISSGTDLNTLTKAGSYHAPTVALVGTLLNCPVEVGFRLLVAETTATARLSQILIANDIKANIYKRFFNGSAWNDWQRVMNDTEATVSTGLMATSSNYLSIFPNGSFNDAQPNTVVGISTNVPLTDGPDGDAWTGAPGRPTGTIRGTLITTTQANNPDTKYSGLVQMLIGYRNTSYSPTLSYRIATASEGVYTWSNWSKFEQNGYLHSSNVIVYNGTEDGQSTLLLTDLNDAAPNNIYQIDLNCTEGVVAHHPSPGVSSVLMCYAFSYTTRHGMVQTLFNVHNEMFYRYGYLNNTDDYRWTPWVKVNTSVPNAPTTNGTYTLQCTVSNGAATYAWVSST